MATRASIAEHPIHPMLVTIPIGLFVFSFVSDVIFRTGMGGPVWNDVAYYTMLGGIVGALIAALPGMVDWTVTRGRARQVATTHMALNLAIVALYAVDAYLRATRPVESTLPVWLSLVALILLVVSGWLGGELVYVHGVGMADAQHVRIEAERRETTRARSA